MNTIFRAVFGLIAVVLTFSSTLISAQADPTYTEVPIPTNQQFLDINGATYPTGNQVFGGVPFSIPATGNKYYNTFLAPGRSSYGDYGLETVTIPVNVYGVSEVDTLINTYFGYPNSTSATLTFTGSAGTTFTYVLVGGVDIRDYNNNVFENNIISPNTAEVFNNGLGQRLDKQKIILPAAFLTQTLASITLNDTGGDPARGFQRALIGGLTVGVPAVSPQIFASVDPTKTYLHTNQDPAGNSVPVLLSSFVFGGHALQPGDTINLAEVGDFLYSIYDPNATLGTGLTAVFSSNNSLLDASLLNRVPGAIGAGDNFVTSPTYFGNQPTDIPEDFFINLSAGTNVTIPAGAQYLFLSAADILFSDNANPHHNLRLM